MHRFVFHTAPHRVSAFVCLAINFLICAGLGLFSLPIDPYIFIDVFVECPYYGDK